MRTKTKAITFKVEEPLFDFLGKFAKDSGLLNRSELIRKIIDYFYMGCLLGEFKKPYDNMQKDFLKMAEKFKNTKDK